MVRKRVAIRKRNKDFTARERALLLHLFELLRCVFRMIHPDTQEIEGINSLVKQITDLAPFIGIRLLTSRIVSNKSLPHFNTPALREQLVQEFVDMHAEVQKFVNDADKAAKATAVGPSESGVAAQPAQLVQPVQPEPVAERPPPQPAPALNQSQTCVAKMFAHAAAAFDGGLGPSSTRVIVCEETDQTSGTCQTSGFIVGFKYYAQLWGVGARVVTHQVDDELEGPL